MIVKCRKCKETYDCRWDKQRDCGHGQWRMIGWTDDAQCMVCWRVATGHEIVLYRIGKMRLTCPVCSSPSDHKHD